MEKIAVNTAAIVFIGSVLSADSICFLQQYYTTFFAEIPEAFVAIRIIFVELLMTKQLQNPENFAFS